MRTKDLQLFFSSKELKSSFPISEKERKFISTSRRLAQDILQGKEKRKALIVGPCSVHEKVAILDFAKRYKNLSSKVKKSFFCVLRFFVEKPRTHLGWKGYIYDPMIDGSNNITFGIIEARKMLLELAKMKIPCAMEFLDPLIASYFDDLITWGFIGSRTCSSQIHRQLASSLDFPIGFKNASDGDISSPIYSAHSASTSHSFLSVDDTGHITFKKSNGNPYTHIVLRGSKDKTNYDKASIDQALVAIKNYPIANKLIIDCSHGNKNTALPQIDAFKCVIDQIKEGSESICGIMLESFIKKGRQDPKNEALEYGLSITDECLSFEKTEELILSAHTQLL